MYRFSPHHRDESIKCLVGRSYAIWFGSGFGHNRKLVFLLFLGRGRGGVLGVRGPGVDNDEDLICLSASDCLTQVTGL
jgi:hypothetical protein